MLILFQWWHNALKNAAQGGHFDAAELLINAKVATF
jgi:hypothetical protein